MTVDVSPHVCHTFVTLSPHRAHRSLIPMTHSSCMIEVVLLVAPGQTGHQHGEDRRTGPMRPRNRLASYEERLDCLWQRLVATLGIHTARVLLARAVWPTAQRPPDIVLIR